jgi:hypothetical protein
VAAKDLLDRGNGVRLTHLAVDLGPTGQPEPLLMQPWPPNPALRRALDPP